MPSLAARLLHARTLRGLTQQELAAKAHVSQGTIGNVEKGIRKKPRDLVRIARALEVSPEWLGEGTGPMDAPSKGRTGRLEVREEAARYGAPGMNRLLQAIREHGDSVPDQFFDSLAASIEALASKRR
jgi:transcriptional regulator with XRE-family HTH domain